MKKYIIIIAVFLLVFVPIYAVFAEGETAASMYYTNKYTVDDFTDINYDFIKPVDIEVLSLSSGSVKVEMTVETYETMQKLGFTSLKLQRKNGSSWITEDEITNEFDYITDSFSYINTFAGCSSGSQYRIKVVIRARRVPGEVQELTITSDSIICH